MKLQRYKSSGHYSDGACDHGEWVKAEEAEAAIAERDAQIVRLCKIIDKLTGHVSCDTTGAFSETIERNSAGYASEGAGR
jgi:hypothetical protein